jgi:citrate lyase subunit beta/citryl-CoA lyase
MLQVETPRALFEIEDIARWSTTLSAVSLGAADFALEMGSRAFIRGRNRGSTHVQFALQKLLHVARAVGWNASDSVGGARADDLEGVRAAMIASRDLGFDGVATMYPSHVPIANEVFGVSDDDLAWALETIAVYEAREPGRAVTKSDGYIVLPAHYECALRLRELHAALTSPAAASV